MTLESQFKINHNTLNLQLTYHLNNATTNKEIRKCWPFSQRSRYHHTELINMPHLAHHLLMRTRSLLTDAAMVGLSQEEKTVATRVDSSS